MVVVVVVVAAAAAGISSRMTSSSTKFSICAILSAHPSSPSPTPRTVKPSTSSKFTNFERCAERTARRLFNSFHATAGCTVGGGGGGGRAGGHDFGQDKCSNPKSYSGDILTKEKTHKGAKFAGKLVGLRPLSSDTSPDAPSFS